MGRLAQEPLREMTEEEQSALAQVARASSERADRVARAKMLLAVEQGTSFIEAARSVGRRSNDAVARWVKRFNAEGLLALDRRHGGGPPTDYGPEEAERILRELRRTPDPERDGTATWSLTTLQRALRKASDGLPKVSTWTILRVLREAGYTFQQNRTWCETGKVKRKQKGETVEVTDPQAEAKRGGSSRRIGRERSGACRSGRRTKPDRIRRSLNRALPGSRKGDRLCDPASMFGAAPPSC
jgi:transposase